MKPLYRNEAADILRMHVIERRHRVGIKSLCLDQDPGQAVPRMSDSQFILSCALVRGVPEFTLDLLEEWVCGSAGSTWTVDAVVMRGEPKNIPKEQVAIPLKMTEAAELLGQFMTYKECKALYSEAQSIVLDNLIERSKRELDPSYAK